ncbi:MAG: ATP-dependent DNA helicase [Burkholderiaceae bacterium]
MSTAQLTDVVADALSGRGALAAALSGFVARPAQLEMAQAVARAIETNRTLVAEAGTGTGKTFAYLVPALLSGGKVLLSTATKTLQDQLFDRDIPLVRAALGKPVTIALLKGRANYLCHHYLQRTLQEGRMPTPKDVLHLEKIRRFAAQTRTGDRADCTAVPEHAPVWTWVTSTRENCLGSECAHYQDCFVVKARREALNADVVVVNHHLFLADTALRGEGVAELLPAANTIIFDEAHQLADAATLFFGKTITWHQWHDFVRDLLIAGRATARDAADWDAVLRPLDQALQELRAHLADARDSQRWPAHKLLADRMLTERMLAVGQAAGTLAAVVELQAVRSEEWQKLAERLTEMTLQWSEWLDQSAAAKPGDASDASKPALIRWAAVGPGFLQLHTSPMDIADSFQQCREGPARSWIFTSATLSVRNRLEHFMTTLGLSDADAGLWPSPFAYQEKALLCVPQHAPAVSDPDFSRKLCAVLWPILQAAHGGVFFLCTTLRAVAATGQWLKEKIREHGLDWTLLVQGEDGKAEMLSRFRAAARPVLVGSASFWEGVDVKGDQLRLVIIDKLPFAPPDDPVGAARSEWVRRQGGNPFMELHVPEAAIALKQGAGRLIRDEQDRGVLVIGDRRVIEKSYGRMLWQSLPPFRRTQDVQTAIHMLETISTTPATTAV